MRTFEDKKTISLGKKDTFIPDKRISQINQK